MSMNKFRIESKKWANKDMEKEDLLFYRLLDQHAHPEKRKPKSSFLGMLRYQIPLVHKMQIQDQ